MYSARFYNQATGAEYWRTVWADSINEAMRLADRMCRKGFVCVRVTQRKVM